MVALKGAEIDKFVARPDPTRPVVLVFGPDAGLVRERAEALVRASVDDPKDPFQLARLDGDDLAGEPTAPGRGGQHHSPVRRTPRRLGEGRRSQFRARGRGAHRIGVAGLPGGDRGG